MLAHTKIVKDGVEYPIWDKSAHSTISGIEDTLSNSGTWVDTYSAVSANSASWSGNPITISAGSGIGMNVVDDVLVLSATPQSASSQMTLLWGDGVTPWTLGTTITLNEPKSAFMFLAFENSAGEAGSFHRVLPFGSNSECMFGNPNYGSTTHWYMLSGSSADQTHLYYMSADNSTAPEVLISYVYGVFRKS